MRGETWQGKARQHKHQRDDPRGRSNSGRRNAIRYTRITHRYTLTLMASMPPAASQPSSQPFRHSVSRPRLIIIYSLDFRLVESFLRKNLFIVFFLSFFFHPFAPSACIKIYTYDAHIDCTTYEFELEAYRLEPFLSLCLSLSQQC